MISFNFWKLERRECCFVLCLLLKQLPYIGYRRLNKQRSVFPSDTALLKALYLATHEITKKWTMPLRNWGRVLGELEIMYSDRLTVEET